MIATTTTTFFSFFNSLLFFYLLFAASFLMIFWSLSKRVYKSTLIFDTALLTVFFSFLWARILAIISNFENYRQLGFSFLPVSREEEIWRFFIHWPWIIFKINDGNFNLAFLFLGLILTVILIFRYFYKQEKLAIFLSKIIISFNLAAVFLVLGLFWSGQHLPVMNSSILAVNYPDGQMRLPIHFIILAFLLIWPLIYYGFFRRQKTQAIFPTLYLLSFSCLYFILQRYMENYQPVFGQQLDYQQASLVFLALIAILISLGKKEQLKISDKNTLNENIQPTLPRRERFVSNNSVIDSIGKYSVSFADRASKLPEKLTSKEKFTRSVNSFKRRIGK